VSGFGEPGKKGIDGLVQGKSKRRLHSKVNLYAGRGDRTVLLSPGGCFGEATTRS